jgi:tRNA and rRNA cytosine-C5-methylases
MLRAFTRKIFAAKTKCKPKANNPGLIQRLTEQRRLHMSTKKGEGEGEKKNNRKVDIILLSLPPSPWWFTHSTCLFILHFILFFFLSTSERMKLQKESFDRILLDAPCSGFGQRPMFYNANSFLNLDKKIKSYANIQKKLLQAVRYHIYWQWLLTIHFGGDFWSFALLFQHCNRYMYMAYFATNVNPVRFSQIQSLQWSSKNNFIEDLKHNIFREIGRIGTYLLQCWNSRAKLQKYIYTHFTP